MEYKDPYRQSQLDVQMLNDLVSNIVLDIDIADQYYEKAIELRYASQQRITKDCETLDYDGFISNLCVWHGSGYLIHLLGEFGICKHELKRFDCGICSRDVLILKDDDG